MNFWKKLRLIGSVIVLLLAVIGTVGALLQPPSTFSSNPQTREPFGLPGSQTNGTKGL
ncbi:MAG: hypothetical protein IPG23_19145 [Burkholderiales bacterium]|nr:hypothetical protein [Burkholderiales bacterium]